MYKALIWVVVFVALLVGGFFMLNLYIYDEKQVPVLTNFKDAFSFEHI